MKKGLCILLSIILFTSCSKSDYEITPIIKSKIETRDFVDQNLIVVPAQICYSIMPNGTYCLDVINGKLKNPYEVTWHYEWSYIANNSEGSKSKTKKTNDIRPKKGTYISLTYFCTINGTNIKSETFLTGIKVN